MKRILFVLSLLTIVLSACATPAVNTPAAAATEAPTMPPENAPAPGGKLPGPSFEAQTYINEEAGYILDYPANWTVAEKEVGSRGKQVQFLSAPELADAAKVPDGAARVNAAVYQWDPKNDLAAFVANQKQAWEASGFTVLEEGQQVLDLGLPAERFLVQTPDAQIVYLIADLGDQYLVLSGEGNPELVTEILTRVRPLNR